MDALPTRAEQKLQAGMITRHLRRHYRLECLIRTTVHADDTVTIALPQSPLTSNGRDVEWLRGPIAAVRGGTPADWELTGVFIAQRGVLQVRATFQRQAR